MNVTAVAVVGAGSWGTALALLLARRGLRVFLWARDPAHVAAMHETGVNERYLPGRVLGPEVVVTADLPAALAGAAMTILAVPSAAFGERLAEVARHWPPASGIVWVTKGFDAGTGGLLHETAHRILPPGTDVAVLSGPTFASEVAAGLPGAATVGASSLAFADRVAALFHGPDFRIYTSDDIVGVQVGGAVKNVLAIAAGIADGLGFGANTRAALITRGLAELMRLGAALGGRRETFMGLAGLGDLILTCTDDQSRNRRFGLALARGDGVEQAVRSVGQVVEGVTACRLVCAAARLHAVDMPISEQVHRVLQGRALPSAAVAALLARDTRRETE